MTKSKELVSWKEKMAAKAVARESAVTVSDLGFISFRGGSFSWAGNQLGPQFEGIIVDEAVEYSFYTQAWNPDVIVPPDCFALSVPMSVFDGGKLEDGLAPHPKAKAPQSSACESCKMNEWGSGTGRGKACGNRRRLLIASVDLVDAGMLKLPPTALKAWDSYAKFLARFKQLPPEGVVTEVSLKPPTPSSGTAVPAFKFVRELEEAELAKMAEVQELHQDSLVKPFE